MGNPISEYRFLIVDDDNDDFFLIKELLKEGKFDFEVVIKQLSDPKDIFESLRKNNFDLCFIDYYLGKSNGIEIIQSIRDQDYTIPIILLTGRGDSDTAVRAIKAGANDYLEKSDLSVDNLSKLINITLKSYKEEKQRREFEKAFYNQGLLLQGVSEAATRLLTIHDHELGIKEALSILGKASKVDYAFIFNDHPHPKNGENAFSLKYSWSLSNNCNFTDSLRNLSHRNLGISKIHQELASGQVVTKLIDELPQGLALHFSKLEIKSVIFVPIKIDFILWGTLSFADSIGYRVWSPEEISILKTMASSIGGKLKRTQDDLAFRSIVQGISSFTGNDFFQSLVRNLATALPVRCAFVSEILDYSKSRCRVIAGCNGFENIENFEFDLLNTPFEDMLAGLFSYYPDYVQEIFPNEEIFKKFRANSFAGVPFFDSNSKVIGHLSVLDDRPIEDKNRTSSILQIFASRAGAELERKRADETIKSLAYYDSLTGLPNRILLNDRINLTLERAKRHNQNFALMFLDFDHFKEINDNYGHSVGDFLLKSVADRLIQSIRGQDTVARLGGDEFILLFPEISQPADAKLIAEKILELGREPMKIEGKLIKISFSIGIAIFPFDGNDSKELTLNADQALYIAKNNGRDSYHFASSSLLTYK